MNVLLLPIRPEYIRRILAGEKRYEYRTRLCKEPVKTVLLYETSPTKRIVGEARVNGTLSLPKETLWQETKAYAGIRHEDYERYFKRSSIAHAYVLGSVKPYPKPVSLETAEFQQAPQSFAYIRDSHVLDSIRTAAEV